MEQLKLCDKLGDGAYGKVYKCIDMENRELAVKCVPIQSSSGIPCLIEPSIMMTFDHPYINKAVKVYSTENKLYILQKLAVTDLRQWSQKSEDIEPNILRKWLFGLAQAVHCLHSNNIIHGDLKASNVLYYKNNQINLTDFTLSTMDHWNHNHIICTSTHRPPEVWLKRKWNKEVDIWSLACTFFEVAYKNSIFPFHRKDPFNSNYDTDANINCILDWNDNYPPGPEITNISRRDIQYQSYYLPTNFNPETPLNKLIIKMLNINPNKRPTIQEVIEDEYFMGMSISPYRILEVPEVKLSPSREQFFNKISDKYIYNKVINDLAYRLYSKIIHLHDIEDADKIKTVFWISYKLVNGFAPSNYFNPSKIFINENIICSYLSFRLYSSKHIASS